MSTDSVEKLNNNLFRLNLYKSFNWFDLIFTNAINQAVNEFWEADTKFKLISVAEDFNFFFGNSEYFVTRVKLAKNKNLAIRLSKNIVKFFLDNSLGEKPDFVFEKITELEAKILTAFNNEIYKNCESVLTLNDDLAEDVSECNLTYFITSEKFDVPAKLIISIPNSFINCEEVFAEEDAFSISSFPATKASVDMFVGKTTLPLTDLQHIEKEDIILLEESNINNMTLAFEGEEIEFRISPDPSLIISFDEDDGSKNMSKTNNIWDNIQVDISAEFEKVKVSLGEIKQISEGLVVDIGSLYENEVSLKVENKVIAKGELVIINDRYGVRIVEVIKDAETEIPEEEITEEIQEENIEETQGSEEQSEDFDYKDFDVDDENI